MFNRALLAVIAFAISISMTAAKDPQKKEECPTLNLGEIEELVRKSPTCRRAVAVFELCEMSTSGDLRLGAAVTEKCEADFLGKLTPAQKAEQKRCAHKDQDTTSKRFFANLAVVGNFVPPCYCLRNDPRSRPIIAVHAQPPISASGPGAG